MNVTLKHNGLPENIGRFGLLSMIKGLASSLKLTGREIQYLEAAIRRCGDVDFEKGSICAHWARVDTIAKELGCTPRQVNSIEKSLAKKKFIVRTTGPNGHRFGVRGTSEKINFVSGINLAPMINRCRGYAVLKRIRDIHDHVLAATRYEIQLIRRKIRDTKDALLMEKSDQVLPGGRTSIIRNLEQLNAIHEALLAVLAQIDPKHGLTETSDGQSKSADALEVSGQPNIQTQKIKNICIMPTRKAAGPLSVRQMLLLATPQYRELVQALGGPTQTNFVEASSQMCHNIGISADLWGEACLAFGRDRAALYVLVLDRNRRLPAEHKYHRSNAGGSLVGMIRKGSNSLNLNGLFRAMQSYPEDDGCNAAPFHPSIAKRPPEDDFAIGRRLPAIFAGMNSLRVGVQT
jgi:replication initiation protein RepC